MKRTTLGLRPNILFNLHSSLLIIAMLFFFVSCGKDDNNAAPNTANPRQCFDSINNRTYQCFPGDPNYLNPAQPGQPGLPGQPGFPGQPQVMTFDQVRNLISQMAMNTNTTVGSSIGMFANWSGSETHVIKSVTTTSAQIEIFEGSDSVETYSLTKQQVIEDIFGTNVNYNSDYRVTQLRICIGQRQVNAYQIEEYTTAGGWLLQYSYPNSTVIVSRDIPFFANPIVANGTEYDRNLTKINREHISLDGYCGGFGNPYGY